MRPAANWKAWICGSEEAEDNSFFCGWTLFYTFRFRPAMLFLWIISSRFQKRCRMSQPHSAASILLCSPPFSVSRPDLGTRNGCNRLVVGLILQHAPQRFIHFFTHWNLSDTALCFELLNVVTWFPPLLKSWCSTWIVLFSKSRSVSVRPQSLEIRNKSHFPKVAVYL